MRDDVGTRNVRHPDDDDFLLRVYASSRTAELNALGRDTPEAQAFLRMQYDAQASHYRARRPQADWTVITMAGADVGRLIVDRGDDELHIVDIILLPAFRGAGVGTALVRRLLVEADAAGLPVRCEVAFDNAARHFWERLGLVTTGTDGVYPALERPGPTHSGDNRRHSIGLDGAASPPTAEQRPPSSG
jgi:ribosomal protein S18 acetylase RimI-like enzyme